MDEIVIVFLVVGSLFGLLFVMPILTLIWIRRVSGCVTDLHVRLTGLELTLFRKLSSKENKAETVSRGSVSDNVRDMASDHPTVLPVSPPPILPVMSPTFCSGEMDSKLPPQHVDLPPSVRESSEPLPYLRTASVPTPFERAMEKAWNWLVIGEEFRKSGESWEYAVATNWLLRIGIIVVLAGIAFFLKYSIEKGYMGPLGRVAVCLMVGTVLIVGGVRLLFKKYHLLGQGLAGAGFSTLYFAFFAASAMYHLMSNGAGFVMMACVTVAAGVLAVRYQSLLIAILGVLGGYATPVMLGDSGGSDLFFFSYVLLLGCGVLGISMVRRWPMLNVLGMLASYSLAFLYCYDHKAQPQLLGDMLFLSAVHMLYLLSVSVIHIRRRLATGAVEWAAIFLNAGIYWVWVFLLFKPIFGKEETGLVSLMVSAVYVALVYLCLKRKLLDPPLIGLFIGLAAVILAMSPVLMLSGEWLTLAWCLQALVMLWLSRKTGQDFLGKAAVVLFTLACIRGMLWDLGHLYAGRSSWMLTGAAFWKAAGLRALTFGVLPTTLGTAWRLNWTNSWAPKILGLVLVQVLFYLTFESNVIARTFLPEFREGIVTLVWTVFAFSLLFAGIRVRGQWLRWCGLILFGLAVAKLLMFDLDDLETLYRIIAFIFVGVLLVLGSFMYLKYRNLFEKISEDDGNAVI